VKDMGCSVKGALLLDDELIKMDWDFELKIFHHCIFAFEIERSFMKP